MDPAEVVLCNSRCVAHFGGIALLNRSLSCRQQYLIYYRFFRFSTAQYHLCLCAARQQLYL